MYEEKRKSRMIVMMRGAENWSVAVATEIFSTYDLWSLVAGTGVLYSTQPPKADIGSTRLETELCFPNSRYSNALYLILEG